MATILAFRARPADAGHADAVIVRGRAQTLHIYVTRGSGDPVIVSKGRRWLDTSGSASR